MLLDDKVRVFRRRDERLAARLRGFREVALGLIGGELAVCHKPLRDGPAKQRAERYGRSICCEDRPGGQQIPFRKPKVTTCVFGGGRSRKMHSYAFCKNPLRPLA